MLIHLVRAYNLISASVVHEIYNNYPAVVFCCTFVVRVLISAVYDFASFNFTYFE